jgi:hypothetical protein
VLPEDAQRVRVILYTERRSARMIQGAKHTVTTQTPTHTIKIIDGYLTIEGEQRTLTPEETEQLLDALLIWRYGLDVMPVDALEE